MPATTQRSYEALADKPELSPTLPSWIYHDPEIFEAENECIFDRSWSFIAHTTQLRDPGSFAVGWVNDQSVLVIRGNDGVLRAFHNVCQHRPHELLSGCGLVETITCPYHAWSYDLEGRLVTVQGWDMDGSPERDEFALTPIRVETLAGLVFVNMDVSAAGLADQAPDLEESLRSFIPDIDDLLKCHETVHDIRSNWKVMIENSLECYHCEPCHPGFADAVDMDLYRSVSDGLVTIHTSERRLALEKFGDVCAENPRANRFSYWYIWPTTEIDAAPAPRSRLSVFTRRSLAPDRFRLVGHYFRRYDDFPDKAEKQALARNQTLLEDIAICEAVQRGLTSRGYSQGRFIADPERSHFSEHSVHQFQRLVASALGL